MTEGSSHARPTLKELILGTRQTIAGNVYGTIVVLSVLTAGARAFMHDPWRLVVITAVTVVIFWAAHVYAQGLGEGLSIGHRLTTSELAALARHESSILLSAVVPVGMLALGAVGAFSINTALWLAVGAGVAALTVQGVCYAQLERLSRTGTVITVGINLALGLAIALLKALVAH